MNEEQIKKFWKVMGQIYGRGWYDNNGPEPTEIWVRELRRLDLHRVGAAVEVCKNFGDHYPINLSQFMGRYRELETHHKQKYYHRPYTALPSPSVSPEQLEANKETLREIGKACRGTLNGPKRRQITRPGFDYEQAQFAISEMVRGGMTREEAIAKLLAENGWTEEDEQRYKDAAGPLYSKVCI